MSNFDSMLVIVAIAAAPLIDDMELRPVTTAMGRYAKGVAHAALGDRPAAEEHQRGFRDVVSQIAPDRRFCKDTNI